MSVTAINATIEGEDRNEKCLYAAALTLFSGRPHLRRSNYCRDISSLLDLTEMTKK